jgi:rubredoxin
MPKSKNKQYNPTEIECPECGYNNKEDFDWLFNHMYMSHCHCSKCGATFDENGDPVDHIYVGKWDFDKSPAENLKKIEEYEEKIRATLTLAAGEYHAKTNGIAIRNGEFTDTFRDWLRKNKREAFNMLKQYRKIKKIKKEVEN